MTGASHRVFKEGKGERALKLLEQGLSYQQIAERIGSNPYSMHSLIENAKKRRKKIEAESE